MFLTDEDHATLQEVIRERKSGIVNPNSRVNTDSGYRENTDHQAPEVYIAKVPTAGIPARSGTTLGSAECEIYRVVSGAVESVPSFTMVVFNLSASAISDGYVGVKRDKYGTWLADTGGSAQLKHGVVTRVCDTDCNIYEIEIVERSFDETLCTGTGTGTP